MNSTMNNDNGNTTKAGSRRLEKNQEVWIMMMKAARLLCAGPVQQNRQVNGERVVVLVVMVAVKKW